jgi:golgin subfamily B member 1
MQLRELRSELRHRLRSARDWTGLIVELEREANALAVDAEKSERLTEVGILAEEVVPDRERALAIYAAAAKLDPTNRKARDRMRAIYMEMGRLADVVRVGEETLANETDEVGRATVQAQIGEALVDMGQRERAQVLLAEASEALPDVMRIKDALAAASYDAEDWISEVERLAAEADKAQQSDTAKAARICLRAARILHVEMQDDPAYEQMLRRVLTFDPQNESANYLYEALLAKQQRMDELAAHHEKRAYAAADEGDRAILYRRFGMEWAQRFNNRERGAQFFAKALEAAYENGADELPSQLAAFALLREILGARKEWGKLLALTDQALAAKLGDDVKLGAATIAAAVAWKELGDPARAKLYFDRIKQIAPESALLADFEAQQGSGTPATSDVPTPATPPPSAAPAAEEVIADDQRALMEAAAAAEGQGADKGIDAWKKAVAKDPAKRAPRRELARVLRKAERWTPLVDALKDEEAKAAKTPEEKVAVLSELVELYRDRIKNEAQVAATLAAMAGHQPDNLALLDQLAAQYENMKRWPDLVATLNKKAGKLATPAEKVGMHLRIANLYLEKFNNQAEAIKAFEAALEIDPDNAEAASHLKSVYEKRRDWEKLIALTKRENARVADPAERLRRAVDLAKLASDKLKKPSVSIEAWEEVLAADASNAEALAELEKLYEREKRWDQLAEVSQRQAELAPDAARKVANLQKLGILYSEKVNEPQKAIAAWRQLLAVEPENKRAQDAVKKLYLAQRAWTDLEAFFAAQNKLDEYVRVLERQVETEDDPTKIELWAKIATLYRDQLQKPDRAMRAYERVLGLDPTNLPAAEALIPLYEGAKDHKKLAGVLEVQLDATRDAAQRQERIRRLAGISEQALRDKGAAYGWWLRALAENHTDRTIRTEVERLAKETGGWTELVEGYEKAAQKIGNNVDALPVYAVIARVQEAELAETDAALATNRKILALDEKNPEAVDALERLYLAKQMYAELLAIYDKKLSLGGDGALRKEIRYKVGQLYEEEMGDDDKAVVAYQAILDESGEEREALAALDRIHQKRSQWKELAAIVVRELALIPPEEAAHQALEFRLGQLRETHLGDVAGAIENYRDILSLEPTHEGARLALEKRLVEPAHELVGAGILEPIYTQLESWGPLVGVHEIQLRHEKDATQRVALLTRIGELHATRLGDGNAAFDAYARAFKEDPTRADVRAELERITPLLEELGYRRMIDLYEQALGRREVASDQRLAHELSLKVAAAYDEKLENPDKAVEHYRRALSLEADDTVALEALDRLFSRDEKYGDLLEIYRKKADLARDPEDRLNLLFRIASLWEEMLGNPEEAIATYKEILGHDATNLRALKAQDRLFVGQSHWNDLADNLVRQLHLVDDRGEQVKLLVRLAELRERQLKEVAAAVDTYRQVLELDPGNETATKALERLIADPEQELTIAQILEPIYRGRDDWQKQVGVYEIMVRHAFDPARKIELLHRIGELYEIGGDDGDKAFETYARALREDPAGQETQQRLERLARVLEKWPQLVALWNEVVGHVQDDELKISLLTRIAQIYELELGSDEDAVKTYHRVLEVDARHLASASAIELVHTRNEDYPRLVQALRRKADIVLNLDEKKALFYKAAQIEEDVLEDREAAIATYRHVLLADEIDSFAMNALERLFIGLERWKDLKDIYAKKAEHAGSPEERKQMLFVLGQVYDRELGDVGKAIETYQAILDLDRDDLAAIQSLDRLYGQAARWYDLLGILEREVELSHSTSETVALKFRIGQLWEKELKDLTRAIDAYREGLSLDPMHDPTIAALSGLLHAEGEPVLAAQVLEPIYEQGAEFDKLIDVYEVMTSHADDPTRKVELLHRIAQLQEVRLEKHAAAFEAFGRAFRVDPANQISVGNLERLADATRGWDQLARLYDAELQKVLDAPRQVDLLLRLARVYEEELGQADKAIETYRRVVDVEGDNRQAVWALDRLYENGQRWHDLTDVLRKEVRLTESDEEALAIQFRLGQVYEHNLKNLPAAIDVYREILVQAPTHSPTLGALELLFADGQFQVEIGGILEPLYRDAAEWEKLHKVHEVQLGKLAEPGDRQAMFQRLAELAESRLGDGFRAFRWWAQAFGEEPRSERLVEELERLAGLIGDWEDLVAVYGDVLGRRSEKDIQRSVLLRLARVYDLELRNPQAAEETYLRVLGLDNKDPDALEALDRIYETSGMYPELAEILRRRIDITLGTEELVKLHFRLGHISSEVLGDLDAAVGSYDKILDQDSRNRQALESLERIYFRREEWQKLYGIYEKLVDTARGDVEMADVYARMAKIAAEVLGQDDEATDLWGRVIDLRGEDPIALSALADLHERREMWRELVDILERQVMVGETPADKVPVYKRLGWVWKERLGRERNSLEAWLQAYELAPSDLETLRALANLYRSTQSWEELSTTLGRLLEVGQVSGEVEEREIVELYAQLGQLEGEVLGRTNLAVEAWQRVLALEPRDFRALGALEGLFTREGRWEEAIDVLEKKAAVLEDPAQQLEVLLQAASTWEERVGDKASAAQVYERVRSADPGNAIASAQLEAIYREQYQWDRLSEVLLERVEHTTDHVARIGLFQQVAKIYEEEMADQEGAFVVLQAAFKEDYAYESTARELERLATAAGKWEELLADYSTVVAELESDQPGKAADLWVKIARWYGDHLNHLDYAVHSAQAALRLDPRHLGALSGLADFHRKRGSFGELIQVLSQHATIEPDAAKRVDLYLALAELLEVQMQDPMQAIAAYQAALQSDPANDDALSSLDRLYRRHEMWDALIRILEAKASVATDLEEQIRLRMEIGRHWDERLGEPGLAIQAYQQVVQLEPRQLQALRALERLYEKTGQSEQYLDILEQQLDATPTDAERISLYNRMASAWEERFGKLDRSAEALEKILVLDERHMPSYRELERLYRQEKKWDSLVDTLRRHILAAGDPGTRMDLYCAMGQVYEEELRDFDRAIEAYRDVLAFDADDPRALEALGRLFERIEEWQQAIDTMGRLVETTEQPQLRVELQHRIGRIYDERLDDPQAAEDWFLQSLQADQAHVPTMMSLTGLYKKRGDWFKAAQMMVRAEQHTQHPLEKIRLLFEAATIFHKRLHDEGRAMEFYAATIALDPEHVEAGEPLAELYFREKRWPELEPILDMVARKSTQLKKDNKALNELYFRIARTADELGNNDKALRYYKMAYDLDSTYLPTLVGRANLLFKIEDWDNAGKIYQTILVQHRDAQKEGEVVDIYYRLGQVRLKLGERKKALNMFEKALEINPAHRDTLSAVIELQSQQGDFEAVVHAKRSLMPAATANEKFQILEEIGDVYHTRLQNPQKAIAAYLEALELNPGKHSLLQKILEVYTETKQWKKAVEIMLRFAELETDMFRRGKYYYAAGVTSRDELKAHDESVEQFNMALDAYFQDPDSIPKDQLGVRLKAFEAIDRILTAKKDWQNLGRAYRRMIKRMPQRQGDKLLVMLWHNLGEVYRSRLREYKAAAQAFEVASSLEPGNAQRHEILAELYVMAGPEFAEKAVQEHMTMLKNDWSKIDSYKALRKIYMDNRQFDKAWCMCATLTFLKKADPEEQQFFEQYRKQIGQANARFSDETWRHVFHPEQDRFIGSILGAIHQAAALVRAAPFKVYEKQFGLKKKDERNIETDQLVFSRRCFHAAQVLNVPPPRVYIQQDQPGELVVANIEEKGNLVQALIVRANMLQGRTDREVAFAAGQWLTYMRPEHYLKKALQSNTELKTALLSAMLLVQPNLPVKPDQMSMIQQYLPVLRSKLQPQWMEHLAVVVRKFLQNPTDLDLVKWGNAVDATAHRVGFIMCGDLETSAKMISNEPTQIGGREAREKVKELVLYSISEDYFSVRQQLGTVVNLS